MIKSSNSKLETLASKKSQYLTIVKKAKKDEDEIDIISEIRTTTRDRKIDLSLFEDCDDVSLLLAIGDEAKSQKEANRGAEIYSKHPDIRRIVDDSYGIINKASEDTIFSIIWDMVENNTNPEYLIKKLAGEFRFPEDNKEKNILININKRMKESDELKKYANLIFSYPLNVAHNTENINYEQIADDDFDIVFKASFDFISKHVFENKFQAFENLLKALVRFTKTEKRNVAIYLIGIILTNVRDRLENYDITGDNLLTKYEWMIKNLGIDKLDDKLTSLTSDIFKKIDSLPSRSTDAVNGEYEKISKAIIGSDPASRMSDEDALEYAGDERFFDAFLKREDLSFPIARDLSERMMDLNKLIYIKALAKKVKSNPDIFNNIRVLNDFNIAVGVIETRNNSTEAGRQDLEDVFKKVKSSIEEGDKVYEVQNIDGAKNFGFDIHEIEDEDEPAYRLNIYNKYFLPMDLLQMSIGQSYHSQEEAIKAGISIVKNEQGIINTLLSPDGPYLQGVVIFQLPHVSSKFTIQIIKSSMNQLVSSIFAEDEGDADSLYRWRVIDFHASEEGVVRSEGPRYYLREQAAREAGMKEAKELEDGMKEAQQESQSQDNEEFIVEEQDVPQQAPQSPVSPSGTNHTEVEG